MRHLANHDMVLGLPQLEQICDACLTGKHCRTSFLEQTHQCVSNTLNLVHGNLCGPITPTTLNGKKYFLLLVDDLRCFTWQVLLPSKTTPCRRSRTSKQVSRWSQGAS